MRARCRSRSTSLIFGLSPEIESRYASFASSKNVDRLRLGLAEPNRASCCIVSSQARLSIRIRTARNLQAEVFDRATGSIGVPDVIFAECTASALTILSPLKLALRYMLCVWAQL